MLCSHDLTLSVRTEERVLGGLGALGLNSKQTQALMSLDLGSKQQVMGVLAFMLGHWC